MSAIIKKLLMLIGRVNGSISRFMSASLTVKIADYSHSILSFIFLAAIVFSWDGISLFLLYLLYLCMLIIARDYKREMIDERKKSAQHKQNADASRMATFAAMCAGALPDGEREESLRMLAEQLGFSEDWQNEMIIIAEFEAREFQKGKEKNA